LAARVDLTNILQAQIPNAQKKTVRLTELFGLLGSARAKARKMLVKLTPGVNFTNI
jgi:hypothetical protein